MSRGVLWLNGVVESGKLPGTTITTAIQPFISGEMAWVNPYVADGFDPQDIVEDSAIKLAPYDEIVIVALSMGFQLAYDLIEYLRALKDQRDIFLVACDALTSVEDVKNPLIAAGKYIPKHFPAGFSIPWLSRLMWRRPPENQHPVLSPELYEELLEHYERTEKFKLGKFFLQARSIAHRGPLRPEVFKEVRAVSIRSEQDELLRVPESEQRLKRLLGNIKTLWVPGGKHATILENQFVWHDYILEAFEALRLQRLR